MVSNDYLEPFPNIILSQEKLTFERSRGLQHPFRRLGVKGHLL